MNKEITLIPAKKEIGTDPKQRRMKFRVAAYCRVSTQHEEQINSFENQIRYYTEYITRNPKYELIGIYADEGLSGTGTRKRQEFNRLIGDCENGKIDLIITKSISRFARNTQDCLYYSRILKNMGIAIYFEKENINTMDAAGEVLFTILSSLAQEESRSISENCKWGIRSNFKKGIPMINTTIFMGYDKDSEGRLIVNHRQAATVRRIFRLFEEGWAPSAIGKMLRSEEVRGVKQDNWPTSTIENMLMNEKYKGDIIMQKTFTADYLTKQKRINNGEVDRYYIRDAHEAIIPRKEWDAVQMELQRRKAYKEQTGIHNYGHPCCAFVAHVICGCCGKIYRRKSWSKRKVSYWVCDTSLREGSAACPGLTLPEPLLYRAFDEVWDRLVEKQSIYRVKWERQLSSGDPLEWLRAEQMLWLMEQTDVGRERRIRMVLDKVIVREGNRMEFSFLDGTRLKYSPEAADKYIR